MWLSICSVAVYCLDRHIDPFLLAGALERSAEVLEFCGRLGVLWRVV